jgi:hypothetical protein
MMLALSATAINSSSKTNFTSAGEVGFDELRAGEALTSVACAITGVPWKIQVHASNAIAILRINLR